MADENNADPNCERCWALTQERENMRKRLDQMGHDLEQSTLRQIKHQKRSDEAVEKIKLLRLKLKQVFAKLREYADGEDPYAGPSTADPNLHKIIDRCERMTE